MKCDTHKHSFTNGYESSAYEVLYFCDKCHCMVFIRKEDIKEQPKGVALSTDRGIG
jgi:hypothetical protein